MCGLTKWERLEFSRDEVLLLMVVVVQGKEVTSTFGRDLTSCFLIPFSAATTITLAIANQKLWWCDEEKGGTDGLRFAERCCCYS